MGDYEVRRHGQSGHSEPDNIMLKEWSRKPGPDVGPRISLDAFSDHADDELSTISGFLLSAPASPFLPQFMTSGKLPWITQPAFIVTVASIAFIFSSSASHIENRFNMYQATFKFPYPLTLLVMQLLFTEVLVLVLILLAPRLLRLFAPRKVISSSHIEQCSRPFEISLRISFMDAREHLGLVISFVTAHGVAVVCLLYVPINRYIFYTSPMLFVQYILNRAASPTVQISTQVFVACMAVMLGYTMVALSALPAVHGTLGDRILGIFTGLVAAIAFPIYYSLLAKTLTLGNLRVLRLLHILSCASTLLVLPPLFLSGEIFKVMSRCYFLDVPGFWLMMFILSAATALSFLTSFMLAAYISSLSIMLLCYARSALITAPFATWLGKDVFSIFFKTGWLLSLASMSAYFYLIRATKI